MKKLIVLSFVAALSVAGCSKKKAEPTTPTTPTTEPAATEPAATEGATDATKPADPCAGAPAGADPCAGGK
jgi:hypothetical protein